MASASASTSRQPLSEVIIDFADGGSYIKAKLEQHVLAIEERKIKREQAARDSIIKDLDEKEKKSGGIEKKEGEGKSAGVSPESVKMLVDELKVTPREAEQALKTANGDYEKALGALIVPASATSTKA